jgi:hypothetical protein
MNPFLKWRGAQIVATLSLVCGCSSGFSGRTEAMRTALDAHDTRRALDAVDRELRVKRDDALPARLRGDDALLVLNRASLQQAAAQPANSKRDFEVADKALEFLDLSRAPASDVAKWVYSDDAGPYVAPAHEKLLVNVLNLVNYLETHDLSGARVEARRLAVTARYLEGRHEAMNPVLRWGAALAGFAFEHGGDVDESRIWYRTSGRTDQDPNAIAGAALPIRSDEADVLVVVGWGRVPHRIAKHIPIGMALSRAHVPGDDPLAADVEAHGLLTWVHYPELAPERPLPEAPRIDVDDTTLQPTAVLDVTGAVRAEWEYVEPAVMRAAVTRAVVRFLAGKGVEAASKASGDKDVKAVGTIFSLILQIAMNAADTPDTRSWESLPGRLALYRARVRPGRHEVRIALAGESLQSRVVEIKPGDYAAATAFALW